MSKLAYITAAILVIPAPALAQIVFQDTPPAAAPAPAKAPGVPSDLDKIECRMQETIGSRLQAHKVCMTKQQWFQAEQDEKNKVKELQDLTPVRPSG